ncbi:hypothetical protein M3231_22335 [Neobacillus mesonae]|nr:hypothetical protein [Neobacillus mesonae]
MKKLAAFPLAIALTVSGAAGVLASASVTADAAAAKEWVQISERITYYGEVKDGVPHGSGTIKWGNGKQYSGQFALGKRSGTGKYINEYVQEGELHKVVYSGDWKNDKMDGKGTQTHKISLEDGTVQSHQIQNGIFTSNQFGSGYDVIHALADPDFSFTYKNGEESIAILGSNVNMRASWQKGQMFSAVYKKGSVVKEYSIFPGETKAEERRNAAALKYLQSIKSKVSPHLEEFERLSRLVPLR